MDEISSAINWRLIKCKFSIIYFTHNISKSDLLYEQ
jgi:hypothetical protein